MCHDAPSIVDLSAGGFDPDVDVPNDLGKDH